MSEPNPTPRRLADDQLILARQFPRATWDSHANLGGTARFWLSRHEMFRKLDTVIKAGTDQFLADKAEARDVNPWLVRHLNHFLGQLEEHHHVEDHHFFPVFRQVEPRLTAGFELLESDHDAIHAAIGGIVDHANKVLGLDVADRAGFGSALARFRDAHVDLGRSLIQHLDDEEDLVIPLFLDRGEENLIG